MLSFLFGNLMLRRMLWLLLLVGVHTSHAATPNVQISSAEFRQNALQIKGRLRNPAGLSVEVFDLDGHSLGLAPIKAKKYSFTLDRAKMTSVPCGIVAEAGGIQVMKPVKRAPEPCKGLTIKKAQWLKKKKRLNVAGHGKAVGTTTLELYDLDGNLLASEKPVKPGKFAFNLESAQLKTGIPCSIKVTNGTATSAALVSKAPAGCTVLPIKTRCAITEPANNSQLPYNQPIVFKANAQAKDSKAKPIKYEWDFAGGVMGHPAGTLNDSGENQTQASFIRNNSTYRVRFAATDAKGERCEAAIEVSVGTPPTGLPPKVPEQPAPKVAGELDGTAGDLVVLPFEDWTMQTYTDSKLAGNSLIPMRPPLSTINTEVYRKARLPELLGPGKAELFYSAASNSTDPVGGNSITSTSQNLPVGSLLAEAKLPKSDLFETWVSTLAPPEIPRESLPVNGSYIKFAGAFLSSNPQDLGSGGVVPDEGYQLRNPEKEDTFAPTPARAMPGIANPYTVNDPQPFDMFSAKENRFKARALPLSDIDDQGRINPFPLFRVEARVSDGSAALAATDTVLSATRDLHCRECHGKGGVGAKSSNHWSPEVRNYYHSDLQHLNEHDQPRWFEAVADNLFEREFAAQLNILSLHDYYDGIHFLGENDHDYRDAWGNGCVICHRWPSLDGSPTPYPEVNTSSATMMPNGMQGSEAREGGRGEVGYGAPGTVVGPFENAAIIHSFHGRLIYNAAKDDIQRWPSGRFRRWVDALDGGPNPNPLFPVKDAKGNLLPMEENCLKCHGGQREQAYRDRHFTAGLTCYQCHGDMMAMGRLYPKTMLNPDGLSYRVSWFEQPDCGSCHTGNANRGADKSSGFFSAGVMNAAFDENDPAATSRRPNLKDPDQIRFAVPLATVQDSGFTSSLTPAPKIITPLFRLGKDAHGNVSCAACHGGAHATWPNRDPNANDNVTAMQLQGHTGSVLECNVCHTAEAFLKKDDLDGGVYMGVPAGVLGGPHNLHPINDPNWWKEATDQPNGKAGWHDDYAMMPGTLNEDQCAACHGNDHKGTRLSKTPIAREFVDENGKKVKVKAGAIIGCDLCHSIEKSCQKSPNPGCGSSEGKAPAVNRPPVFTSMPVTEVVKDQIYLYTATASDPDGDPVTLSLTQNPTPADGQQAETVGVLTFEPSTGKLTGNWATLPEGFQYGQWSYRLTANDGRGGIVNQAVTVKATCPSGLLLSLNSSLPECVVIHITSQPTVGGIDAGQIFTYSVKAEHGASLPLTYTLAEGAPEGMVIDANGVLTWKASATVEVLNAEIIVTDGQGNEARQPIYLLVCSGSQHWDTNEGFCKGPITITSPAPNDGSYIGLSVGNSFSHQVTATHEQGLPIIYGLTGGAATMTINSETGTIQWLADDASVGEHQLYLTASDGQGGLTKQPFYLIVCAPPAQWNADNSACE